MGSERKTNMPIIKGSNSVSAISVIICCFGMLKLAGKYSVISSDKISGVVTRQASVVIAVTAIDKALLPRAMWVKIFDVVPPGIAAINAIPIATPPTMPVERINI